MRCVASAEPAEWKRGGTATFLVLPEINDCCEMGECRQRRNGFAGRFPKVLHL
jgi:hypothetical protein